MHIPEGSIGLCTRNQCMGVSVAHFRPSNIVFPSSLVAARAQKQSKAVLAIIGTDSSNSKEDTTPKICPVTPSGRWMRMGTALGRAIENRKLHMTMSRNLSLVVCSSADIWAPLLGVVRSPYLRHGSIYRRPLGTFPVSIGYYRETRLT